MSRIVVFLCLALAACPGAPIDQDVHPVDRPADPARWSPQTQHRPEPAPAYSGLTVEQVTGETGSQDTGEFMLASGEPVAVVQIWCQDGPAWYLVPDPKIYDGLVEFQCSAPGRWRALIVH